MFFGLMNERAARLTLDLVSGFDIKSYVKFATNILSFFHGLVGLKGLIHIFRPRDFAKGNLKSITY